MICTSVHSKFKEILCCFLALHRAVLQKLYYRHVAIGFGFAHFKYWPDRYVEGVWTTIAVLNRGNRDTCRPYGGLGAKSPSIYGASFFNYSQRYELRSTALAVSFNDGNGELPIYDIPPECICCRQGSILFISEISWAIPLFK